MRRGGVVTEITMSLTEDKRKVSSVKTNEQILQNVVTCVANLSLVNSTGDACTARPATKESHPVIKSVSNLSEMGIKVEAAAAAAGVPSILTKPEPQITIVKEFTCQGIDELEEILSILQQPVNKVISDTSEPLSAPVACAEEATGSTVAKVKNAARGVAELAPETAQGSMEATTWIAMESAAGQMGACSNTFSTQQTSDAWLDPFLPVAASEQLVKLATSLEGLAAVAAEQEGETDSYAVRLGMLPNKVRQRFVEQIKSTVQSIQDDLLHLQITFDLVEYSKRSVDQKEPDILEELKEMWLAWSTSELNMSGRDSLLKSEDFPDAMLQLTKLKILKARILLHDLLDYVAENITLTWCGGEPRSSSRAPKEGAKGTGKTKRPSSRQSK
ncbi:perilipin-3-like isoform X4 [Paroedura picta]|uniref:perilipin-3-like isoform X4 n=1 Tax=Paroedura picta TaxID=143630 RepID=UPI004057767C